MVGQYSGGLEDQSRTPPRTAAVPEDTGTDSTQTETKADPTALADGEKWRLSRAAGRNANAWTRQNRNAQREMAFNKKDHAVDCQSPHGLIQGEILPAF
jgi:hypothetical protein